VDQQSIIPENELQSWAERVHREGGRIVFTNGCFDLLHPGHIALLKEAAEMGEVLIVAINSDESVRRLKGESRPLHSAAERAEILLAVRWVNNVTVFEEDTPLETIQRVRPDVLVKGAEYGEGQIVGEELLKEYGGLTVRFPMRKGHATSDIIRRITSNAEEDPQA
jgi:D-beta-D-heptose 7-phosphate kinase/D-beta-D-heptose 1-phosphate adenosyltransferase